VEKFGWENLDHTPSPTSLTWRLPACIFSHNKWKSFWTAADEDSYGLVECTGGSQIGKRVQCLVLESQWATA
jgi:hypothetical protein